MRRWRETGSLAPGQIGGQKKRRLSGYEDWLHEVMTMMPDITLSELQSRLATMDVEISMQAINTTLYALGYRLKRRLCTLQTHLILVDFPYVGAWIG